MPVSPEMYRVSPAHTAGLADISPEPCFMEAGRTTFRPARFVVAMQVISTCDPPGIQSTKETDLAGSFPGWKNSL
jgi:hypothetical protein